MKKNEQRERTPSNKKRLLPMVLLLAFILNSIWTPVLCESKASNSQNGIIIEPAQITPVPSVTPMPGAASVPQQVQTSVGSNSLLSVTSATYLTVTTDVYSKSIVLSWVNPTVNFSHAVIQRWVNYGEGAYWRELGDTTDNTYTDINLSYFTLYKYRVIAVDSSYNYDQNPPEISAQLIPTQPIMLDKWELDDDGKVNARNVGSYGISANFYAAADIVSLEYELSTDNVIWNSISPSMIKNDYGLEYSTWNKTWARYVYMDFTSYDYNRFWIRATAIDKNNVSFSDAKELSRDLICEDVTDFKAIPDVGNSALVLSWSTPADFDYADLYKETYYYGSWSWSYIQRVTGTSYTDTNVKKENPYLSYRYKIIAHDKSGNESKNPPEITGSLTAPGPVAFKDWYFSTSDGKINQYGSSGYTINASFYSLKPISAIQYKYSLDNSTWFDMTPFISSDNGVQRDQQNAYSYHIISINIGAQSGIPDGNFYLQAVCTDTDGNKLTESKTLVKDATPPANVTNITATPNEDNSAIVLKWTNPVNDMSYIIIERDGNYISPANFNLDSYTDINVKSGQKYSYKFHVYDAFGNRSVNPPSVDAILATNAPVLGNMVPENNYVTKDATLNYSATFRSDKAINRITFEASKDSTTWIMLKDAAPSFDYDGYRLYGTWDISSIIEEEWKIRATAYDLAGGTTSEVRTVIIDHRAQAIPSNFKAEITSLSPNTVLLTWDAVDGATRYFLSRIYANPNDGYYSSDDYINAPQHSYIWSNYLQAQVPYIFKLQSVDRAGNMSGAATFVLEIYAGPQITLDKGYDVYTNNSSYTLTGATTPGAEITINGSAVGVGADGSFSYSTSLTTQDNTFTLAAIKDGLTHTVKQRVTFDTVRPTINEFSPWDDSILYGKSARLYISAYDDIYSNMDRKALQVSKDDGATWITVMEVSSTQSEIFWDTTGDIGRTGPLPDGAYKFRPIAWDKAGNSTDGNPVRIWKIDNTKPEPPTALAATQETGKIRLSWLASTSPDLRTSSQYWIYRSSVTGSMYSFLGTSDKTSYEDISITDGSTYYYVVAAKDNAGNMSVYSNEVSASPVADTTAPEFTYVPSENGTYGGNTMRFYITATDNSPRGVDKFKLELSRDGGATWQTYTAGAYSRIGYDGKKEYYSNFELSMAGMTSGSYSCRFIAIDYSGNVSVQTRNITLDVSVDTVKDLAARSGEGAIILQWTTEPDNDIYYYEIHRSTYYSGGFYSITSIYDKTASTYSDKSVEIGKTYYYKIITKDVYSNESASGVVSATAHDDITPPVITAVNVADSALIGGKLINLIVSATDNKIPTGIEFSGSQDGGVTWKRLQAEFRNSYLKSDNVTYDFYYDWSTIGFVSGEIIVRMIAKDAAGNEGTLERTWKLDLFVTPPTNLRATPGDGSILIEWDAVTDEDIPGYPYDVLRSLNPGGPYAPMEGYLPKNITRYTDTSTATGKTYYYVILVRDTFGNESRSSELAAKPAEDRIPPYIDSVSPVNGTTIGGDVNQLLNVYASDNAGMTGATAQIQYSADGQNWLTVSTEISGPLDYGNNKFYFRSNWRLTNLSTGNYKVKYTVNDAAGNLSSQIVDYFVDRTGPSAPKNLFATFGESSIGLVWELPPEADTVGYNVYRANTLNGQYERIKILSGKDTNIYSDNTVQQGLTYFYKVSAIDKYNQEGSASNIASAAAIADTFPPTVTLIEPDHHTILGANAQIKVTAEDNAALSSITLQYNDGSGWKAIDTIATLGTAIFNWSTKPLSGNVQVRAIARDSAGNTSDGSLYRAYTVDSIGPAVKGLRGTSFGGDIVLEWDSVPDADLAYFLVEKKDDLGSYREVKKVYNILGLNVSNLEPATDYWFKVTAFDKMGNSGEPAEIMVNSGADSTPPTVRYEFGYHNIFSGNRSILITPFIASDNVRVKKLILEYSSDGTQWIKISERVLDEPTREVRFNETWDVSALPDGDYYVRALAVDEAGNTSQPSEDVVYTVDHIMPFAPDTVTLSSTAGYIEVKWRYTAGRDFGYFNLWRAEAEAGPYVNVVPGKYIYMGYRDRNVVKGKTYYYKVTTVDTAENESEFSAIASGRLTADTNPPYIYLSDPLEGDILNSKAKFYISFSDDLALKNMKIEYQQDNAPDSDWSLIRSAEYDPDGLGSKNYAVEEFYWENSGIPEGWYKVGISVTDTAGNRTGPLIMRYLINNVPPKQPILTVQPGGWQVSIAWSADAQPEDFSSYKVYKSNVLGGTFREIYQNGEKSFVDMNVQPGIRYYYYIRAYDIYGNYSQSETLSAVPTNEDKILPVANAGDDHILTLGMEAYFDGTLSRDNDRIASYRWDFGDGNTAMAAQPNHAYSVAGSYTAILTVTDPAGNTSSDSISVKVVSPDEVGVLEVKVLDDVTGELLPGSSVVIDFPDGATWKTSTNSVGAAFVIAPPGEYEIFAFKTGFKPASMKVTMARGQKNTIMIRLPKGAVVTGELKAERMNLDEIIAAGIDVTNPANQNAYKFEIGLGFNMPDIPIIVTKERIIRPPNAPLGYEISEDGNRIIIREKEKDGDGEGDGDGKVFYGERLILPDDVPAMAYMVIPGKTTWLKEFFDIGFTIQNAADPQFVIEDAWARLKIPDGLSLAPTREDQHEYIDMGSIRGGESKGVSWIIRGDKKGEYRLEAEFNGRLMPFEDEIKHIFRNDEPFRIWAGDALTMHIITQDRADKGYPYYLKVGIENVSDVPVYNITLEMLEETKQNYIYAPNQELSKTVTELKAGEVLWMDYYLVPTIEGVLSLGQSSVLKTGGNADIEKKMSSISVPENSPGVAPVLQQENRADGKVSLSWGKVEGATGYKIYRIREDLLISRLPELVYNCGPEVLTVELGEPNGPKDYIINTLTADGKEIMRHAITGFSWIENANRTTLTIDPEILVAGRETEILVTAKKGGFPLEFGRVDIGDLAIGKVLNDEGVVKIVVKPEKAGPIEVKLYLGSELLIQKTIQAVLPEDPKQPKGLKAEKGNRKAVLTWFPNGEPELDGYYIYQIKNNNWVKISSGIIKGTSFVVDGLKDSTTYTFQISAIDIFKRESDHSEPVQVTLGIPEDVTAPWVVATAPVNQGVDVLQSTDIKIRFSENIALHRAYENIQVVVGGRNVAFEPLAEGNILTLTLKEELPFKTHCKVTIPIGAVRDRYFNELDSDYILDFYTEMEQDSVPPALAGVYPKENSQQVTVHSSIFLYFSEEIAEGAAYKDILLTANGSPVPHSKEIDGSKIIIKSLEALPYSNKIQILIPEAAVVDRQGNISADRNTVVFYTETVPDLLAPKVIRLKPSANSMDIPVNEVVNVFFSERIKKGEFYSGIVLKAEDQIVASTISIEGNVLYIKPLANLLSNKVYHLIVPAGALTDMSGNLLLEKLETDFITGEAPGDGG